MTALSKGYLFYAHPIKLIWHSFVVNVQKSKGTDSIDSCCYLKENYRDIVSCAKSFRLYSWCFSIFNSFD